MMNPYQIGCNPLPTTTSGVAQQGTCGNYATAEHSQKKEKRGGRQVKRQQEVWKGRHSLIGVGTLNIGTMTGRGREQADLMEQRNVDQCCQFSGFSARYGRFLCCLAGQNVT